MRGLGPAAVCAVALAAAGCGGQRQDADEPSETYRLRVTRASFPAHQTVAEPTRMRIEVRNAGRRTAPDVAVTVRTKPARPGAAPVAFGQAESDPRLADLRKPVWVLDDGPKGGSSAYTNTWALGALGPGESATFAWRLTAVKAGSYTVAYRVSPGLDGKAKTARGERVKGAFKVRVSDAPVPARVDDNGEVVRGEEAGADR